MEYTTIEQSYSLFPNPNNGRLSIVRTIADQVSVDAVIYNALGIVVYEKPVSFSGKTANLWLEGLPMGIYVMKLSASNGTIVHFKFVKE